MPLYKRNKTWWVDITTPDGKRIKRSTKTKIKREAKEFHDKLTSSGWEESRLGIKSSRTWDQAALKWLKSTEGTVSYKRNLQKLGWFQPFFGGMQLIDIKKELIEEVIGLRYEDVSGATANRYIAVISAVLKSAVEWEWLVKAPKFKRYDEKKKRIRWLKPDEYLHLLKFLPDYMSPLVQFSVATGLRQSNVKLLKWEDVDLVRNVAWVHPDEAKGDEAIGIPLNDDAVKVLKSLFGNDLTYVFTRNGKPILSPNNRDWRKALVEAGIEKFRWHDLRHTWASWHVQNGTPLYVLKELGAWKTLAMVEKYAHLAPEHLAQYVGNVLVGDGSHGTNTVQAA